MRAVWGAVCWAAVSCGVAQAQARVSEDAPTTVQRVFARVLSRQVGLRLEGVDSVTHEGSIQDGPEVRGVGVRARLDGLEVTRLQFPSASAALGYVVHVVRPERTPLVADARGSQVVVLRGPRASSPRPLRAAMSEAWAGEVFSAPSRPMWVLKVATPPEIEASAGAVEFESVLLIGEADNPAYELMLERLGAARAYAEGEVEPGPYRVEFLGTNHFVFATHGSLGASHSEVLVTRVGALAAVTRSADRTRVLVEFAHDFLDARRSRSEPESRMLALTERLLQ